MKLDATAVRYLDDHTFRVLSAVEQGSKNHEIVPTALIAQLSHSRSGGVNKALGELAKRRLVSREQNAKYSGYRLTYGGYDYLACRTFSRRGTIYSVGNQIGTGKESDIYVVADEDGKSYVLKIHRLGRLSFRSIKSKRDYLRQDQSTSWMYMSRLAAAREYSFMKALHENGFPVPKPIDQNRHCIVMELVDSFPMRQVESIPNPARLYDMLLNMLIDLAKAGLVHGDFNEFNVLLKDTRDDDEIYAENDDNEANNENGNDHEHDEDDSPYPLEPVMIDFPQMLSIEHPDAELCFERDVEGLRSFFKRRFRIEPPEGPTFNEVKDMVKNAAATDKNPGGLHVLFETALQLQDLPKRERIFAQERDVQDVLDTVNYAVSDDEIGAVGHDSRTENGETDSEEESASFNDDSTGSSNESTSGTGSTEEQEEASEHQASSSTDRINATQPRYQYTRRGLAPSKTEKKKQRKVTQDEVASIVAQTLAQRKKTDERRHHGARTAASKTLGRQKGSKKKTDKKMQLATFF